MKRNSKPRKDGPPSTRVYQYMDPRIRPPMYMSPSPSRSQISALSTAFSVPLLHWTSRCWMFCTRQRASADTGGGDDHRMRLRRTASSMRTLTFRGPVWQERRITVSKRVAINDGARRTHESNLAQLLALARENAPSWAQNQRDIWHKRKQRRTLRSIGDP